MNDVNSIHKRTDVIKIHFQECTRVDSSYFQHQITIKNNNDIEIISLKTAFDIKDDQIENELNLKILFSKKKNQKIAIRQLPLILTFLNSDKSTGCKGKYV